MAKRQRRSHGINTARITRCLAITTAARAQAAVHIPRDAGKDIGGIQGVQVDLDEFRVTQCDRIQVFAVLGFTPVEIQRDDTRIQGVLVTAAPDDIARDRAQDFKLLARCR